MKEHELLELLERSIEKLSIKLNYDDLKKGEINTHGGAYVLRGERFITVHKHLSPSEKIDILFEVLSEVETEEVHLPPEVRRRLEEVKNARLRRDARHHRHNTA